MSQDNEMNTASPSFLVVYVPFDEDVHASGCSSDVAAMSNVPNSPLTFTVAEVQNHFGSGSRQSAWLQAARA
jgi:hypothetical protein